MYPDNGKKWPGAATPGNFRRREGAMAKIDGMYRAPGTPVIFAFGCFALSIAVLARYFFPIF